MPSLVLHTSTKRPWLLAAACVAAAHAGVLYALWDGSPSGFSNTETVSPAAVAWVIPAPPLALSGTKLATPQDAPRAAAAEAAASESAPKSEPTPLAPPADSPVAVEAATPALNQAVEVSQNLAAADSAPPQADHTRQTRQAEPEPAPPPASTTPPPSSQWHFEVRGESKGLNYTAHATMDWHQDGQLYEARLELKAFLLGSRVQTSTGTLGPDGLTPQRFSDHARKEKRLVFDHEAQLIRLHGSDTTAPLAEGVQDRLSLFMQLSSLLAARAEPPAVNEQWSLWVAGSPEADNWTFRYLGQESLQLPAGRFEAWHLQRTPRHSKDQRVDLWFAPALRFLPVRIRIQQDNGDSVDQLLSQPPAGYGLPQ